MHKPNPNATFNELLVEGRKLIAEHGHLVLCVPGRWPVCYTVGLTPKLGYELFTVGLPISSYQVLTAAANKLSKCDQGDEEPLTEVANMALRLAFLDVGASANALRRLNRIVAFGYLPQRMRQVLLPDINGLFPGETGYSMAFDQSLAQTGL
jgi:hypothetical protein